MDITFYLLDGNYWSTFPITYISNIISSYDFKPGAYYIIIESILLNDEQDEKDYMIYGVVNTCTAIYVESSKDIPLTIFTFDSKEEASIFKLRYV